MADKIQLIANAKITEKGVCEFEELFKHLYRYLSWRKYDITETKYKEKWTGDAKEVEIIWECKRDADEYTRYQVDVKFLLLGVVDIKKQKEGYGELKMQKGEFNIQVDAYLVLDYDDKWEKSSFLKFLKAFFEKYLYVGTLDTHKALLWKEGWEIHNEIKAFLNLYRY